MTDSVLELAVRYPEPVRRPLQIYAFDPMVARLSGQHTTTVTVPYEPLERGPSGALLTVVDYNHATGRCYEPVDLDDPRVLLCDGLAPDESDPRFHQQMAYAVVSALLENFERALGRRFRWRGDRRLRVYPHAFEGRNAMFDPDQDGSLRFGYFRADAHDPGRNLPGQTVFTCLSHDIVVHETTHALVHRLRRRYQEPTNLDVYAFHEGFADAVALLQHFTLPDVVDRYVQESRADLTARSPLVELAQQFGEGSGMGRALRGALGDAPDPRRLARTFAPHARGAILVAAVFDGFFTAYRAAIADLFRFAAPTAQALHPDLVRRLSEEARTTAQRVLTMCLRAFQYLPPVDVTFGDFLRSLVTADRELYPNDNDGLRAAMVEGFRKRGIYPVGVSSLADAALAWPDAADLGLPPVDPEVVRALVLDTELSFRERRGARPTPTYDSGWAAAVLEEFAEKNAARLGLEGPGKITVDGFHAAFRDRGGQLRVDVVIRFVQTAPKELQGTHRAALGGLALRGGATVVADSSGRVRYVVSRATPGTQGVGEQRLRALHDWVSEFDGHDLFAPWADAERRVVQSLSFARVDGSI